MPKTMPSCGHVFSAIALDLNLGEEHGLDLARDIRNHVDRQAETPLIASSVLNLVDGNVAPLVPMTISPSRSSCGNWWLGSVPYCGA